uniref:Uncharacterized protein n=1 Tax=Arion vulgaris TaxID=1028688 RepID=A0A0B6YXE0_9EUPU
MMSPYSLIFSNYLCLASPVLRARLHVDHFLVNLSEFDAFISNTFKSHRRHSCRGGRATPQLFYQLPALSTRHP